MDNIAQRLGLVIHWISFIAGAIASAIAIFSIFYILFISDNGLRYDVLFDLTRLSITTFFIPLLLGWLIRYILSGKIHILPWK